MNFVASCRVSVSKLLTLIKWAMRGWNRSSKSANFVREFVIQVMCFRTAADNQTHVTTLNAMVSIHWMQSSCLEKYIFRDAHNLLHEASDTRDKLSLAAAFVPISCPAFSFLQASKLCLATSWKYSRRPRLCVSQENQTFILFYII